MNDQDEPLTEHAARAMKAAAILEIKPLVPHLDTAGLELLRQRLKLADLAGAVGNVAEIRANLLDDVCRRLADLTGMPLSYYVGAGDVLPSAPDDAGELLGP